MQQQVVLKLSMEDSKKRAKAMKCVVGMHGVTSASHEGDKITVVGEGIDSVTLTTKLRRKMGYVELLALTAVKEKKEETNTKIKVEESKSVQQIEWPSHYGGSVVVQPPYGYYMDARERRYYDNSCSIM